MSATKSNRSNADRYQNRASAIWFWRHRSDELCEAAKLTWHHSQIIDGSGQTVGITRLYQPSLLLFGLSLELLLKALLIARDSALIKGNRLDRKLMGHNLVALCGHASIACEQHEHKFLQRTQAAVIWTAKYPVPSNANELDRSKTVALRVGIQFENDLDVFHSLRLRVLALLDAVPVP
jgi:hypothetical protein